VTLVAADAALRWVPAFAGTTRLASLADELLQPVDVVVAGDEVLVAH
jgi:hypothetical protein